jgi:hypothetical protein
MHTDLVQRKRRAAAVVAVDLFRAANMQQHAFLGNGAVELVRGREEERLATHEQ